MGRWKIMFWSDFHFSPRSKIQWETQRAGLEAISLHSSWVDVFYSRSLLLYPAPSGAQKVTSELVLLPSVFHGVRDWSVFKGQRILCWFQVFMEFLTMCSHHVKFCVWPGAQIQLVIKRSLVIHSNIDCARLSAQVGVHHVLNKQTKGAKVICTTSRPKP